MLRFHPAREREGLRAPRVLEHRTAPIVTPAASLGKAVVIIFLLIRYARQRNPRKDDDNGKGNARERRGTPGDAGTGTPSG